MGKCQNAHRTKPWMTNPSATPIAYLCIYESSKFTSLVRPREANLRWYRQPVLDTCYPTYAQLPISAPRKRRHPKNPPTWRLRLRWDLGLTAATPSLLWVTTKLSSAVDSKCRHMPRGCWYLKMSIKEAVGPAGYHVTIHSKTSSRFYYNSEVFRIFPPRFSIPSIIPFVLCTLPYIYPSLLE